MSKSKQHEPIVVETRLHLKNNKRLQLLTLAGLVVIVIVAGYIVHVNHDNSLKSKTETVSLIPGKISPDASALAVVTEYTQAREDAAGADQTSQTSWINSVKSISTKSWLKSLQSGANIPTGDTLADYQFTHQANDVIEAKLSDCLVNQYEIKPTATSELVICDVDDYTVSKLTGNDALVTSLPGTWTQEGYQLPVLLNMVKDNGKWLVNKDSTNTID